MFDRIAPSYDTLNRVLSLRRDVAWRRKMADFLPEKRPLDVLDLATGTGDQLISLRDAGVEMDRAVGMDLSEGMLEIGRTKMARRGWGDAVKMETGDVLAIPAEDASFDAVSISFGIRNVLDVPAGLREMRRVLRPGGKALILECSLPNNRFLRFVYLLYFRHILPTLGGWVSSDASAYRYLNQTVESFPCGEDFCSLMRDAGFVEVGHHPMTLGVATLYYGVQAGADR